MSVEKRLYGTAADGSVVTCWKLTHPSGASVEVLDYGAATRTVKVPGADGLLHSVCMSLDDIGEYEKRDSYSGAIVGRHAGRIRRGAFSLNGEDQCLSRNHGEHHHHGGFAGFSHRIWSVAEKEDKLYFSLFSPHGEEGYPGNLSVTVCYEWSGERELTVTMSACSDADTVVSLTHHGYWNLSGEDTVSEHRLQINAPTFVDADEAVLPTGKMMAVGGTPFDFRSGRMIGCPWEGKEPGLFSECGYDHTFPVPGHGMRELGVLSAGGMEMRISSTLPTLHVYTGKKTHVALEAQFIPDAVHHAEFPTTVLEAGKRWQHMIRYHFDNK